ncbi:MAG UNVERIFIED_CONTAM: hypothetical protein LVQ98_01270 [Rickettsiaceae bacterium]|jgi:hypothetical protein
MTQGNGKNTPPALDDAHPLSSELQKRRDAMREDDGVNDDWDDDGPTAPVTNTSEATNKGLDATRVAQLGALLGSVDKTTIAPQEQTEAQHLASLKSWLEYAANNGDKLSNKDYAALAASINYIKGLNEEELKQVAMMEHKGLKWSNIAQTTFKDTELGKKLEYTKLAKEVYDLDPEKLEALGSALKERQSEKDIKNEIQEEHKTVSQFKRFLKDQKIDGRKKLLSKLTGDPEFQVDEVNNIFKEFPELRQPFEKFKQDLRNKRKEVGKAGIDVESLSKFYDGFSPALPPKEISTLPKNGVKVDDTKPTTKTPKTTTAALSSNAEQLATNISVRNLARVFETQKNMQLQTSRNQKSQKSEITKGI